MLFQILGDLASGQFDPVPVVALLTALVLGITVHEFSHALAATWLGDTLPERQGRLTLAPLAHLDVMGSLMFLIGGFGWGKPVMTDPRMYRMNPRTGSAIVALAGPLSNVVFATLIAIPFRLIPLVMGTSAPEIIYSGGPEGIAFQLLFWIIFYNLVLAVFNLIPIFPLDGFSILLGVLPAEMAYQWEQTRQWGMFLLIALLLLPRYVPLIGSLLNQPVNVLRRLLIGF